LHWRLEAEAEGNTPEKKIAPNSSCVLKEAGESLIRFLTRSVELRAQNTPTAPGSPVRRALIGAADGSLACRLCFYLLGAAAASSECSSLPGLKRTALPGVMLTSVPVRGLRPMPVLRAPV
jgi:hypothetical protein